MIRVANPDSKDYRMLVKLFSEYERAHVARWRGTFPLPEHEIRANCAHYLDDLVVLLKIHEDIGQGFIVTGEKNMSIGSDSYHVGFVYHVFSKSKGGGTELMDAAEESYKKAGIRQMGLHVHVANGTVLPFFRKKGYKIVTRGNNIISMTKELPS